jgi:monovalent cation/proton antiporter MnhG/PhaG subunit
MDAFLTVFGDARAIVAAGLLALGLLALILGGVAQARAADFYTRLHALAPTFTLGGALVLAALAVAVWDDQFTIRLVLLAVVLLAAAPAMSHLLANAAHAVGLAPRIGSLKTRGEADPS